MKTRVVSLVLMFSLTVGFTVGADEPKYPGQPHINQALRLLTDAQTILAGADANLADATDKVQKAHEALQTSVVNKGTYRVTAIRLTEQAVKNLQKGEKDAALHKIDEALQNTDKAGQAGSR